jgi:SAM-dependent methyltransferase
VNHLILNKQAYNNVDGMGYVRKLTQQMRIQIALDFLKEVSPDGAGASLLSIGCCTGEIEELFIRMGLVVYGIDNSPIALREARKRGVITKQGDICKRLPYPDASFNFVFAGEIIEHVMHTRSFLSEIHRVLKPGGMVIITTPNLARIEDRFRFLLGKTPKHTTPIHDYLYLHIRPFTLDSLRSALTFTQFKVEKYASNYVYLGPLKASGVSRILAKIFPSLGKTLIIRARKL